MAMAPLLLPPSESHMALGRMSKRSNGSSDDAVARRRGNELCYLSFRRPLPESGEATDRDRLPDRRLLRFLRYTTSRSPSHSSLARLARSLYRGNKKEQAPPVGHEYMTSKVGGRSGVSQQPT